VSEIRERFSRNWNFRMNSFYVSGGRLRSTIFRKLEEWQSCDQAVLIELDPVKNQSRRCVEYVSPPEVRPDELPALLFKSATLRGNQLIPVHPLRYWFTTSPVFGCSTSFPCPVSMISIMFTPHSVGRFW